MQHLPFNPEPLLAFFMTAGNAGSLVGDLEERFQRVCQRKGRMLAVLWYAWALLISLPPLILYTLGTKRSDRPVFVVLDNNLIVSFFLSGTALELALMPSTETARPQGRTMFNPLDKLALEHLHLTTSETAELRAMWKLRNNLVHRTSGYTPPLTRQTIERLHRLIKRLRESSL